MAYAMESYLFDVSETYENANWDCIIDALLTLASYADCEPSADYGFVIVKTDTPKENCVMIQTAKDYGKKEITLEVRYEYQNQKDFRQYAWNTTDFDAVLQYFYDFVRRKSLDVSQFEDITQQLQ